MNSDRVFARRIVTFAGALAFAGLAGCAYSPYVNWETQRLEDDKPVSLQVAINHAYMAKGRYEQALDAETRRQTSLSNGLIVLGAATMGLAVSSGIHRADVARLALIGGTAYTLGTWNSSRPREEIYLEAAVAMTCAVDAVQPFNMDASEKQAFDRSLSELDTRIKAVVQDTAILEVEIARVPGADAVLLNSAKSDVAAAKAIVDTASDVYAAGVKLRQERNGAGAALMNTVNSIGALVNRALRGTLADLSALPGVIKGLAASTEIVAPGLGIASALADRMGQSAQGKSLPRFGPENKGAPPPPDTSRLLAAIATLKISAAGLVSYAHRIGVQIQNSNAARPTEKLKACKVEVDTDITVSPAQVVFLEKDISTKRVVVTGGKKPYVARILDTPAPFEVHSPITGDSTIEIVGSDKLTAPNRYSITIMDAANHSKVVTVLVQAASSTPVVPDPPKPPGTPNPAAQPARTTAEVGDIQAALCVSPRGPYGPKTREAVALFQAEAGEAADGTVTDAQLKMLQDQLKKRGPCAPDRMNFYEASLTPGDIKAFRKRLKLDDDIDRIDPEMRERIKNEPISFGNSQRDAVAKNAKAQGQLTGLLRALLFK